MSHIPVKGKDGFYRDSNTNAILNKNHEEYQNYVANRKRLLDDKDKMKKLEDKVESLSSDIGDIKDMLSSLLNNNK